jgi:hypothetical protein
VAEKPTTDKDGKRRDNDPPDAGLGMLFKYPGDARKLRDRSKMRLWTEYLRGIYRYKHPVNLLWWILTVGCSKKTAGM